MQDIKVKYDYKEVSRRYREWHHPPLYDVHERMASCQEDYREELGIPYVRYRYKRLRDTRFMRWRGRDQFYRRLNCTCFEPEGHGRWVIIRDDWGAGPMCVVCGKIEDKWGD